MEKICPDCNSDEIISLNRAQNVLGTIGAMTGAICCLVSGLKMLPPHKSLLGMVTRIYGGGSTGAMVGRKLGELIDYHILNNESCSSCGNRFSDSYNNF